VTKGRPSLWDNPHSGRMLIRNFIEKYGRNKFEALLNLGVHKINTKSSIARELEIGFGTISRIYAVVFKVNKNCRIVTKDTKEFLKTFYEMEL